MDSGAQHSQGAGSPDRDMLEVVDHMGLRVVDDMVAGWADMEPHVVGSPAEAGPSHGTRAAAQSWVHGFTAEIGRAHV